MAEKKSPYDLDKLNLDKESKRLERQNEAIAALAEAEFPPIETDARILEVGSGEGFWAKRLARKVPAGTVVCLDHSESLLATARAALEQSGIKNAEYVLQDVTELSFPRESFNIIHSRMTLSHVAQIEQAMEHLDAILKPGEKFVLFEPVLRPSQAPYYHPHCPASEKLFVSFQEAVQRRGSNYTNILTIAQWLKGHNYNVQLKALGQTLWNDEVERYHLEVALGALNVAREVLTHEEFEDLQTRMHKELKVRPLLMFWSDDTVLIAEKPI